MPITSASQARVAEDVVLDGRLALFHERQRWLAVADLHYGYELSQRAAGRLVPLWGMQSIEQRLERLVAEYRPRYLVLVGDLIHDGAGAVALQSLLSHLGNAATPVVLGGNHDARLRGHVELLESWECDGFRFHHGHCAVDGDDRIQVIGHQHPTGRVTDGAGLRLKLPAFVQEGRCWVLPAFSPWAGGVVWRGDEETRLWLCTPERILRLPQRERAAAV